MKITRKVAKRLGITDIIPGNTRNKMGAVRTEYNGRTYASKAEAAHATLLDIQKVRWEPQPRFHLGCPENTYVADFAILDADGNVVRVHEVKGHRTAKFKHDMKLWKAYGPCPLHIFEKGRLKEVVVPQGKSS